MITGIYYPEAVPTTLCTLWLRCLEFRDIPENKVLWGFKVGAAVLTVVGQSLIKFTKEGKMLCCEGIFHACFLSLSWTQTSRRTREH